MKNYLGFASALILAALITFPATKQKTAPASVSAHSLLMVHSAGSLMAHQGPGRPAYLRRLTDDSPSAGRSSLIANGPGLPPYPPRLTDDSVRPNHSGLIANGPGLPPYPPRLTNDSVRPSESGLIANGPGLPPYPPRLSNNSETEKNFTA